MLSATFNDRGGGANDRAFSVNLSRSRAIFRDPETFYIIRGTCYTSQADANSGFPSGCGADRFHKLSGLSANVKIWILVAHWYIFNFKNIKQIKVFEK